VAALMMVFFSILQTLTQFHLQRVLMAAHSK
jgi:hypothetical protein